MSFTTARRSKDEIIADLKDRLSDLEDEVEELESENEGLQNRLVAAADALAGEAEEEKDEGDEEGALTMTSTVVPTTAMTTIDTACGRFRVPSLALPAPTHATHHRTAEFTFRAKTS